MFLKKLKTNLKKINFKYFLIPLVLLLVAIISITFFYIYTLNKVSPGIKIAGIDLSNKTKEESYKILLEKVEERELLVLINKDKKNEINLNDVDFSYDITSSVEKAFLYTRSGNFFYDIKNKIKLLFKEENLGLEINLDEEKLQNIINIIAKDSEIQPIKPKATLTNKTIVVEKGVKGLVIDYLKLRLDIGLNLTYQKEQEIIIPFKEEGYVLSETDVQNLQERASKIIGKTLTLSLNDFLFDFNDQKLVEFIDPVSEYYEENLVSEINSLSLQIDKKPQDSIFVFEEGRVKEFTPSSDGYELQKDALKTMIIGNLRTLEAEESEKITLDIPVNITKPKIQNKDVNNLGIEILLGRGSSKFAGSIANRVYNVGHASAKFKGIIVPPGENFSFNKTLGDVSQETGYKQAYIIKEGKTILGDGGGVCQVSTTLFRAVLDAGLPILERQAHAYRVGYYEQDSPPGLDATVYDPHPDLVFKNDTPNHILIQSIYNESARTLVFEIYGTSDGRISKVTKPIITSSTPPPEDLYQDDPTLPLGTIKQIEHKAWGAKVRFDYEVTRNGEILFKKTFYSNYQPWQAVYLRGTMPQ